MPRRFQKRLFKRMMNDDGLELNRNIPRKATKELPRVIAAISEGIADVFFAGNPIIGRIFGELVYGGLDALMSVFKDRKVEIPNMPPVITCPKSITRTQEPGRRSALVTWNKPMAFDVEDGKLTNIEQTGGASSGSRFSGEEIISYRVKDSEGRSDTCSFYVTVNVIKCRPIPLHATLQTNCSGPTYLGESCSFTCTVGHTLTGPSSVTCTADKVYDRYLPTCEINTCPKPALPTGGERWDCSDSYNYNSVCTIDCASGYRISNTNTRAPWNAASTTCQSDGSWTIMPTCKDISEPTITNCPGFIRHYADRGKNSTAVEWPKIIGVDASGGNVTVTQTEGPPSGSIFEEGAHEIAYEVVDGVGLKDTCIFFVNVDVRTCPAPQFQHEKLDVSCNGRFTHGSACTVTCKQGIELQGSDRITCEVVNDVMTWHLPSGPPTCLVKDCRKLSNPPNARLSCSEYTGGTICYVKCLRGYIPARNAKSFSTSTCSPATGIWKNADHPGCVKKRIPLSVKAKLLFYWKSRCDQSDRENVTATFSNILSQNSFRIGCQECRVESVRSSCIRNKLMAVRWAVTHDIKEGDDKEYLNTKLEGVGVLMNSWFKRHFGGLPLKHVHPRKRFVFKGAGSAVTCGQQYKPNDEDLTCAACAPGYEFDGDSGCRLCPKGTYQDDTEDLSCTPCPKGRETLGQGTTKEIDCKARCKKGSYSRTGLTPCRDCPVGKYQTKENSKMCESCPEGHITSSVGADKEMDCYAPASPVQRPGTVNKGSDFIQLKWMRPRELNGVLLGYDIAYYASSEDPTAQVDVNVRSNGTLRKMIIGLEPDTEYVFTIWAVTHKGRGLERTWRETTMNLTETTTTTAAPTTIDPNLCPPGTNSWNGMRNENGACTLCSKGFYQDMPGQTYCKVCAAEFTTWNLGSTSDTDCIDSALITTTSTTTTSPPTTTSILEPCEPGHISKTGFKPDCRKCPKNKLPNKKRKRCKWCPRENGEFVCTPRIVTTEVTQPETTPTTEVSTTDDANRTDKQIPVELPYVDIE